LAEGRCPGLGGTLGTCGLKGRGKPPAHAGFGGGSPVSPRRSLATLRAADLFAFPTQDIGLRPKPWAELSRPVGPIPDFPNTLSGPGRPGLWPDGAPGRGKLAAPSRSLPRGSEACRAVQKLARPQTRRRGHPGRREPTSRAKSLGRSPASIRESSTRKTPSMACRDSGVTGQKLWAMPL
jgi:hypothetical protein